MYGGKQWQSSKTAPLPRSGRREMLEILNAQGHATVTELCGHFQVSPATIRNDLNEPGSHEIS